MSYDTIGSSYCPFGEEYDDALIAAIREYAHYKTSDGLAPVVGGPDIDEVNSGAQGHFVLPRPTQENFPVKDFTAITYVFLRRWLQANGKEAVAALAEDCIQYIGLYFHLLSAILRAFASSEAEQNDVFCCATRTSSAIVNHVNVIILSIHLFLSLSH